MPLIDFPCRASVIKPFALALALSALLAGCAGNPTSESGEAVQGAETGTSNQRVATPNPYLTEPASVPGAAKKAMMRAREFFQQQKYNAAETELQQVVTEWPELSGAWLNLAKVQLKLDNPEQAEQSLRQAVAVNANNVFAWNSLGVLLRDQGQFEEARQAYESALRQWPDFAIAHRNLGILFDLYLHQPAQALHHYREAQALQAEKDRVLAGWIMDLERRM